MEADVLHVADTWWNGYYPFIDYSTGGSIDGTIRATEANLTKVTDRTIIIPGHGPVGDKSQLAVYHDMLGPPQGSDSQEAGEISGRNRCSQTHRCL
jgi:glyoxylase-like metal-dependent hydrolase (beta-lactamase superfamily II)